jgi:hypothetical protein
MHTRTGWPATGPSRCGGSACPPATGRAHRQSVHGGRPGPMARARALPSGGGRDGAGCLLVTASFGLFAAASAFTSEPRRSGDGDPRGRGPDASPAQLSRISRPPSGEDRDVSSADDRGGAAGGFDWKATAPRRPLGSGPGRTRCAPGSSPRWACGPRPHRDDGDRRAEMGIRSPPRAFTWDDHYLPRSWIPTGASCPTAGRVSHRHDAHATRPAPRPLRTRDLTRIRSASSARAGVPACDSTASAGGPTTW